MQTEEEKLLDYLSSKSLTFMSDSVSRLSAIRKYIREWQSNRDEIRRNQWKKAEYK